MNKQIQRALQKMSDYDKATAIDLLMASLDKPYMFVCKTSDEDVTCRAQQGMATVDYCNLLASFMIATAKLNGITPIKILSAVGESMSELMQAEDNKRTAANRP